MDSALTFQPLGEGNFRCAVDLSALYPVERERQLFEHRWSEFLLADPGHGEILDRQDHVFTYPHKSWLPNVRGDRPALLTLLGNPAPHSVAADVYFAWEGRCVEHRFWKVLRDLYYVDLHGDDTDLKRRFLNLEYRSPFRLGFDVIYTFPSSASRPKWAGVLGVQRLFGKRAADELLDIETARATAETRVFLKDGGAVVAMQKDAYNAIADNSYDVNLAVQGMLLSTFDGRRVYGTPPTRWLHTSKMNRVLAAIRDDVLAQHGPDPSRPRDHLL